MRVGRALYQFAIDQTPTDRERTYIQMLLVDKDPAKEIRAYELGRFLRSRFAVLYERRIQALRRLVRRRSVQGVVGGGAPQSFLEGCSACSSSSCRTAVSRSPVPARRPAH